MPEMKFERIVPKFLGDCHPITYISGFWENRNAILYTICFAQLYTHQHTPKTNEKLLEFMKKVSEEKEPSTEHAQECIAFLETIENKSKFDLGI